MIAASSSAVYGSNSNLPKKENDWTRPLSPYGISKLATEGYALAYRASYGLKTLAFRFFNVCGPRQASDHAYAAVVPKFIDAALTGEALRIYGDGTQSRDFTFVDTLCQVIESSIFRQLTYDSPINFAINSRITFLELITELEQILGQPVGRTFEAPRVGDVKDSQVGGMKVNESFPEAHPAALVEGLERTLSWHQKRA